MQYECKVVVIIGWLAFFPALALEKGILYQRKSVSDCVNILVSYTILNILCLYEHHCSHLFIYQLSN